MNQSNLSDYGPEWIKSPDIVETNVKGKSIIELTVIQVKIFNRLRE